MLSHWEYCTISFNSYVTCHGQQNIRNFSYMSRVTEGIYEYPKQVTKWAKNGSKNRFFVHTQRLQFRTLRHSNESLSSSSGILRRSERPLWPLIATRAVGFKV